MCTHIYFDSNIGIQYTTAPELGLGCHSYNAIHGTTLNPFNLSLSAGGSSGGAAAALASKMLCVSDGSDMFGSLRNPAGWNNLYSLRPTSHWMEEIVDKRTKDARESGRELDYPISTIGPMARCPEDLAMFLSTMLPKGVEFDAAAILDCSPENLNTMVANSKIGWLNNWGGEIPFEEGVLHHCKDALDSFAAGNARVTSFTEAPFSNDRLWESWVAIRSHKILSTLYERIGCEIDDIIHILELHGVKPEAIWECEQGKSLTTEQLQCAVNTAHEWSLCAEALFKSYDFLALPSSQIYPFNASLHWPETITDKKMDTYHRWMNVMVPVTLLGLPCVTVPCGAGLPIGLCLFAKKGCDAQLLMLARWYHKKAVVNVTELEL
jgi:amidase